jgi:single-strand selective monofunctional uracil DNA glycosylase
VPARPAVPELERIAARLRDRCGAVRLGAPVAFTYNPLDYAWEAHRAFLRMARPRPRVLFVGMNPGPFGMAQTGVPFGEVAAVRGFLGITPDAVRIGAPARVHPKRPVEGLACARSEVSGARVWSWASERFGTRAAFFREAFVWNWCPLAFMAASGANLTPDRLPRTGANAKAARELEAACDEALGAAIAALGPAHVVGFGAFAATRAQAVLDAMRSAGGARRTGGTTADRGRNAPGNLPPVLQVLHPSPASPAANRGWAPQVDRALAPILPACASRCSTSSDSPRRSSRAGRARASRPSRSARAASAR